MNMLPYCEVYILIYHSTVKCVLIYKPYYDVYMLVYRPFIEALVRFQNATDSFLEGGGNQSINVVLYGGELGSVATVEVYIDDGTTSKCTVYYAIAKIK